MATQDSGVVDDKDLAQAEQYAARWLKIIQDPNFRASEDPQWLVSETLNNFTHHLNAGWVEVRKSVTCGGDYACVEWRGRGCIIEDILGRKFIDCLGGFGLLGLGWSHPEVVAAVKSQLEYHSPQADMEMLDPLRGVLAKLLATTLPGKIQYCFFCNSGTEAVEGAIKLAKLYTGKTGFISSVGGFHGKTMGSLSVSGKATFREPLKNLYGGSVFHVPYGDADAVARTLESSKLAGAGIAAVIMEPIQGEAGAVEPPEDFWPRLRQLTRQYGVLLIADEVQTGMGRTGKLWGVNHWDVEPDIITLGKALGGGVVPMAAFCSTPEIWDKLVNPNPYMHSTTTGGNPLACASAIAALRVTIRDRLWEKAAESGAFLKPRLQEIAKKYPKVLSKVTGRGLLLALHFETSDIGYQVASHLFNAGVMVAGTLNNSKTVRIEPPLIISHDLLATVLEKVEVAVKQVNETISK